MLNEAMARGKTMTVVSIMSGRAAAREAASVVDEDAFDDVGHAILGILLGLTGGGVGRWFYRKHQESEAIAHGP